MDTCPYCAGTGFVADDTHTPDALAADQKPDEVRWLNRCSSCGLWSVWSAVDGQQKIPDPENPDSLE